VAGSPLHFERAKAAKEMWKPVSEQSGQRRPCRARDSWVPGGLALPAHDRLASAGRADVQLLGAGPQRRRGVELVSREKKKLASKVKRAQHFSGHELGTGRLPAAGLVPLGGHRIADVTQGRSFASLEAAIRAGIDSKTNLLSCPRAAAADMRLNGSGSRSCWTRPWTVKCFAASLKVMANCSGFCQADLHH
jgi:hypothetical protein